MDSKLLMHAHRAELRSQHRMPALRTITTTSAVIWTTAMVQAMRFTSAKVTHRCGTQSI